MPESDTSLFRVEYAIPQFVVHDAAAAAEYYRDRLGFEIQFTWGTPSTFAAVRSGGAVIHLISAGTDTDIRPNCMTAPGITDAYFSVRGVDALHSDFVHREAKVVSSPRTTDYGMREFTVEDADGYWLCFGEELD